MSDNVSLSLDEYIKRQKRQNPKKGKGAAAAAVKVKGKAKSRNQTFRYYQAGNVRAQNVRVGRLPAAAGRKGGLGRAAVAGGGAFARKRGQFNKRNNNNNNRLNTVGKNRLAAANKNSLDVRARRFGGGSNLRGAPARNLTRPFNQPRTGGARGQLRNKRNWKKNANRSFTNSLVTSRINNSFQQRNNNGGVSRPKGNVRLQKLIRKRIKNARSLLASKGLVTRNQRLAPPQKDRRRNIGLVVGGPNRQLAQQKLNRAKLIRARIQNNKLQRTGGLMRSRGLSVDRNNLVRVRVANDFRQNYGAPPPPPSNYHPASAMYSAPGQYPSLMPPPTYGMPDSDFPPFTMHNTVSQHVDEMEVCRSSLDPNIQRKISVIQNRARNSNMSPTRVMSDFKAPVSSSAMKLGDRFRMMMR